MSLWASKTIRGQVCSQHRFSSRPFPPYAEDTTPSAAPISMQYKKIADLLSQMHGAWRKQNFRLLRSRLEKCDELVYVHPPNVACFVAFGGIDLFVHILCDPFSTSGDERPVLARTNRENDRALLWSILNSIAEVLTDVLTRHSESGWYFYDRYPGLLFRLLELASIPRLSVAALAMLEHILSCVGPVLEIAKNPLLINLIRTKKDGLLAGLCRVIALLIVPAVSLGWTTLGYRQLLHPESVQPLKRVQRIVDSNVLWLLGETGLLERLITLCEVHTNGIRVQQGNRTMTFMPPNATNTIDAWFPGAGNSAPNGDPPPPLPRSGQPAGQPQPAPREVRPPGRRVVPDLLPSLQLPPDAVLGGPETVPDFLAALQRALQEAPAFQPPAAEFDDFNAMLLAGVAPFSSGRGGAGGGGAGVGGTPTGPTTPAQTEQFVREMIDAAVLPASDAEAEEEASIDLSWFFGTGDVRQRWRLRDPSLLQDRDDNRPYFLGYGMQDEAAAVSRFQENNQAGNRFLDPTAERARRSNHPYAKMEEQQLIVDSQSEVLFVLNVMLSTFYFSEAWQQMRECNYILRANPIFDIAFGLGETDAQLVELLPHIKLSDELRHLPRFQPTLTPCSPTAAGVAAVEDACPNARIASWRLPAFVDLLGKDQEDFMYNFSSSMLFNGDDGDSDKIHRHGPDTLRKMELLRSVHEYWNAQDSSECALVHSEGAVPGAATIAHKIATMLVSRPEDSCVEMIACDSLDSYIKCFSSTDEHKLLRCRPDSAQSVLGAMLLGPFLETRVYNATRVPGLSTSLKPLRRLEAVFSVVGELVRFHYNNLATLRKYICDEVPLERLNEGAAHQHRANPVILSQQHEAVEAIMREPPLERGEHEPFGRVLLRRVYSHGHDTHRFIRSVVVSLTPGLRSSQNYVFKPTDESTESAALGLSCVGRLSDTVSGAPVRYAYVRRVSRKYVEKLNVWQGETDPVKQTQLLATIVTELMDQLAHCPHRLPLRERPFPHLLDENDTELLQGTVSLPPLGPPAKWHLPLFGEDVEEETGLSQLSPIVEALLAEPHKLVYSMMCSQSAELGSGSDRLFVVTTVLLLFLREAKLHDGEAGIRRVLDGVRTLAQPCYDKWYKKEEKLAGGGGGGGEEGSAKPTSVSKASGGGGHREADPAEPTAPHRAHHCTSYDLFGSCHPPNDAAMYHHRCGGCFFRSFFRLLCAWIAHYWACQRYAETLYFSTEVAFGEYKVIALCLLRLLPQYFFPAMQVAAK